MKSHASINRIYRLVWNAALGLWVAVAETAKGRSRGGSGRSAVQVISAGPQASRGFALHERCRAAVVMLLAMSVFNLQVHAADALNSTVVVGSGSVSTTGATTTINQASQRLAIDWTHLSTAANEALVFNQPNAQAIALNRIIGSSPSEFLGSLTANGQVFILNPNGVLFGAGSQVNVGGLVASTMSLSNADFAAGNFKFSGTGSGAVVNQGTLTAAAGGYLALLAPEVRNEGVMVASLGTALLAAGNKVTLNLDNGSLLGYSIDQGAINALAENKLLIQADGGQVLLSAKAMDSLTTATVNNTGIIEAKTIQNKAGRILLMGDMEYGTVNIGGTLDASAPNGGDGGFIETSAANFRILPGLQVNARAAQGKTGTWLLDPTTATIAAGTGGAANTFYEDTLEVAGADVVIQATDSITASGAFSNGDVELPSGLNLTIQTTSSGGGTGIDLTTSTHGADLTFKTSGGGSVLMSTGNAGQTLKTSAISVTGGGTINLNSAGVLDISNTTLQTAGGAITLTGAGQVGNSGVLVSQSTLNAGTGALTINGITADMAQYGVLLDRATLVSGNANIFSTDSAVKLAGSSVTSSGNISIDASNAASDNHAVELVNSGATQTNVSTTGGGTIGITGRLVSGGSNAAAASGSAAGVAITNSNVTASSGTITISGDAGWPSGLPRVSRGVRLDSAAKITSAGDINITGRVGSSSLATSKGVQLVNGAEVSSTGGDIALTGTLNNGSILDGTGLHVSGKVQSGASKKITLTGSATVGGSSGTGVLIDGAAELFAGTGGLTIVGTTSSSTTATNVVGTFISGGATNPAISSTGAIDIRGTLSGGSIAIGSGLVMTGGTINSNGANIVLRGSGVPAPAPAFARDVEIGGTTVTSGGGEIQILGDRVNIVSAVNAGAGRVVIAPTTANRQITLAGSSETNALNLSASEINQITAGVLQIGSLTSTGGIDIGNNGGTITAAPGPLPVISLLNAGSISQTGAISVGKLKAVGSSVTLTNAGNQIDEISGQSTTGAFAVTSSKAAPLTVGTVDGYAGINSGSNATTLTNLNGAIAQTQAIVASSFTGSSNGGTTLGLAGNQIGAFNLTNSGSGNIVLANGIATTLTSVTNTGGGRVDIDNTGDVTVASISSDGAATGTTAGTAAISVKSSQGISASGGGTHIANTGAGSLYLEGAGSVGASSGAPLRTSATQVSAQATGAGAQVNLVLTNGGTLENIAAIGSANVAATAGSLAVKTVSGSAVTLAANAGAITDANGAANNITATSLTASSQNGITLGTNVTGAQTLGTTGAAGDITITAANALNTSNLSVSTNAGSAQTVSLASNAGITVGSAFGNSQDHLKLLAGAGNIAINGTLSADKLTLSTDGTASQSAGISATGLELLGTGSHTLNNAGNTVTTLAGNTGNVIYSQAGALAIGTVNTAGLTASGKVLIRTTGAGSDLTLNNNVTSGSAANDSLVLAAGRNFVNATGGATPLDPGTGRYLVYSTDPAANTFGAMVSPGNAFGRTYAANAPSDTSMTSLSGNRMVYSFVPTLNISGDNQSKAFGGIDPPLTYTVGTGLVAGDTATSALSGALFAPTGAATTGPTHAITQGTLASALGYSIAYTNGTLTVTGAPAPAPAPSPGPGASGTEQQNPTFAGALNTVLAVGKAATAAPGAVGEGSLISITDCGVLLPASVPASDCR